MAVTPDEVQYNTRHLEGYIDSRLRQGEFSILLPGGTQDFEMLELKNLYISAGWNVEVLDAVSVAGPTYRFLFSPT